MVPQARGQGAAGRLIERMIAIARNRRLDSLALVSVYNTQTIWGRFGFKEAANPALNKEFAAYGNLARYMVCALSP